MKKSFAIIALLLVISMLTLSSCDLISQIPGLGGQGGEQTHSHNFVEGKCECGAEDPNYVPPHEHSFANGKCECGEEDPNYVPPHEHIFVEGKCECGEEDPNYVPPVEDDERPEDETPADPQPEAPAEPEAELNFFQKIIKAITEFFANIGNWFKNLFAKK